MPLGSRLIAATVFSGLVLLGQPAHLFAQAPAQPQIVDKAITLADDLPDAPTPQIEIAADVPVPSLPLAVEDEENLQQPAPAQNTPTQGSSAPAPQTTPATPDSSSAQTPVPPPETKESKRKKAEEQIKQQEHQRIMGIIPAFNTSYVSDAVSLTPGEKIKVAARSVIDPYTFAIAFIVAGLAEAEGSDNRFGWGAAGYGKRSGAAYLDAVDGTMIGNAFLPILLHQDPRYFRLGHGTFHHRLFYAVATSFICKHDNTGKWEPNYSNVGGNIISGAISNLYYPSDSKSGFAQTIEAGMTVTLEGTFGATLQEFWPDISRRFFHKDPTHGLDAAAARQARAVPQPSPAAAQQIVNTASNSFHLTDPELRLTEERITLTR